MSDEEISVYMLDIKMWFPSRTMRTISPTSQFLNWVRNNRIDVTQHYYVTVLFKHAELICLTQKGNKNDFNLQITIKITVTCNKKNLTWLLREIPCFVSLVNVGFWENHSWPSVTRDSPNPTFTRETKHGISLKAM